MDIIGIKVNKNFEHKSQIFTTKIELNKDQLKLVIGGFHCPCSPCPSSMYKWNNKTFIDFFCFGRWWVAEV
jgi:hypothetical protein